MQIITQEGGGSIARGNVLSRAMRRELVPLLDGSGMALGGAAGRVRPPAGGPVVSQDEHRKFPSLCFRVFFLAKEVRRKSGREKVRK